MRYELIDVTTLIVASAEFSPVYLLVDTVEQVGTYVVRNQPLHGVKNLMERHSNPFESFESYGLVLSNGINWGKFESVEEAHKFILFRQTLV